MSNFITWGYPFSTSEESLVFVSQADIQHTPHKIPRRGSWNEQSSSAVFHLFFSVLFPLLISFLSPLPFVFTYDPPPGPSSQATIVAFTLQASDPSKAELIFPWTINIIPSPSLASSDNCSFGKSTSKWLSKSPWCCCCQSWGALPLSSIAWLGSGDLIPGNMYLESKRGCRRTVLSEHNPQLPVSTDTQSSFHSSAEHQDEGQAKHVSVAPKDWSNLNISHRKALKGQDFKRTSLLTLWPSKWVMSISKPTRDSTRRLSHLCISHLLAFQIWSAWKRTR